ncbi:MAG: hypothetical protein QXF61_03980 [Nitrososphaeria archaeon]
MVNYFRVYWNLYNMRKRAFWPLDKLKKYQERMLHSILRHSYETVPFYHEMFDKLNIKPDEIKTIEDLKKLPILRKDDVRRNLDKMISRIFNVKKLKTVSTSGSTGKPLRIYLSAAEDEYRKAKHLRANTTLGQRPRDKWVTISAPTHFREIPHLQRFIGIYVPRFISVFDDVDKQFKAIERLKPDIIDGYASFLLLLAKEVGKRGCHSIKPRFMISGAEIIDVKLRRFIEEVFQAPLYDQYATVEFERMAWQCKEKNGYHIDFDSIILELVDKDGEAVSPGEVGEVVCTSLFNYAMPLIRYAVGDIAVAESPDVICECGRTFPLLKSIEGRSDSLIVLPNSRVLSWSAFGWAMEFFKFYFEIDQYRVAQKKSNSIDFLLKVRGECVVDKEVMAKELIGHVRDTLKIGPEVALNVKFVDVIPPDTSGKLRKVVSEIDNNLL